MVEDTRGLAHKGALTDHHGVRYRSTQVRVTDTRWVQRDIAMDSAGLQQHSKTAQVDIDGGHPGTGGRQRRYPGESSLSRAEIAGLVGYWCRNVLAHRHGDWDRRGLADFFHRAGQHRKVTEGEAVAAGVGRCEEEVVE